MTVLPSPIVFTASNPDACNGHTVGTLLTELEPGAYNMGGARPDWQAGGHRFRVYQAEGPAERAQAELAIANDRNNGELADGFGVVTNLGIEPIAGADLCLIECYAQAGDQPYGNFHRMRWQAKQDGWTCQLCPVAGVYDAIPLEHYFELNGGARAFRGGHWRGGPLGVYLGEGIGDTGSWPAYDAMVSS